MPRKRNRLSSYDIKKIDPTTPVPIEDHEMVRAVLVDFDEVAVLSHKANEQFVEDLVEVIRYRRCGVKVGKRGLSDEAVAQQIFLSDIGRALGRAGLPVTRWRKRYDLGDGPDIQAPESFYFRLSRELAEAFGMALPQDLKLPGRRAAQHQYGVMSPAMKAAQEAEQTSQRQGTGDATARRNSGAHKAQAKAASQAPPKPYTPPPVSERIAEQTRLEMLAGQKRVAEHAAKAQRLPPNGQHRRKSAAP
jgi:hypothetical protein